MLSKEEALQIAQKLKKGIDNFTEYEDAFVFGCSQDRGFGGKSTPIVILKADGRAISIVEYCDMPETKQISEGSIE